MVWGGDGESLGALKSISNHDLSSRLCSGKMLAHGNTFYRMKKLAKKTQVDRKTIGKWSELIGKAMSSDSDTFRWIPTAFRPILTVCDQLRHFANHSAVSQSCNFMGSIIGIVSERFQPLGRFRHYSIHSDRFPIDSDTFRSIPTVFRSALKHSVSSL
jgi:hypothetical protein